MQVGPQTKAGDALHSMKYRGIGEDFREAVNRIAFALKDSDNHYHQLREILLPMRFLPGGRIQSAMGASKYVTAYNCFVSGKIEDSFVDGPGNIMQRAHEAAATMRMGGGIGYDFSTLRPRGDVIRRLQSHSSGPVSFMRIFNEVCLATSSSGHRRGAQMGVMRVDHPDIEEFIKAKQNIDQLTGFNISVAVTDEFMEAAINGESFDLRFNGQVYRTIDAQALWEAIMRSTFDWAEPGVLFIDRINRMNNLYYCEEIAATNPCGEQPLAPYAACLLGSFNLVKYLQPAHLTDIKKQQARWTFDFDQLKADIPPIIRAMDNVVERTKYPLAEQRAQAVTKRRMGIGITGLANALEACGYPYASAKFLSAQSLILSTIRDQCYRASAELAAEKGSFPLYDAARYMAGKFVKKLPEDIKELIERNGIRNSHLTSIAPTGTISQCADNISSALEPVFAYEVDRPINTPHGVSIERISDYGAAVLDVHGRLAHEISAKEHVTVLAEAQRYVDSACSKTVNVDGDKMSWEEFKGVYLYAYDSGCKACSTFNSAGKRPALMRKTEDDAGMCVMDPESGRMECA